MATAASMLSDGNYENLSGISATEARQRRGRRHRAQAYVFGLLSVVFLSIYAFVEHDGAFLFVCVVCAALAVLHFSLSRASERS